MINKRDPLHLVIVGGGVAGLSAAVSASLEGLRCTVLEKSAKLQEVGAGLQLTPNAVRLLSHWGISDALAPYAAAPTSLIVRRYDGSKVLAVDDEWQENMLRLYGAPFWDVHRADLQAALLAKANQLGVRIRTGAEAEGISFAEATVVLAGTGERVQGDVVLAADGLWSHFRDLAMGLPSPPLPTGDLAYRIILKLEDLQQDRELAEWISKPKVNFWVGPKSHAVGYSVRAGREYNLVLLCPDDLPQACSKADASSDEIRQRFLGWDPILNGLLGHVKAVEKWRLMHLPALPTWNDESGRFTMSGDSCHPMLPYLAQGANSAMEDGAILGRLLGSAQNTDQIPQLLDIYHVMRKSRVDEVAKQTLQQRRDFHLADGPLQKERDEIMAGKQPTQGEYPSRWTCPIVQKQLFGYDAFDEVDQVIKSFDRRGKEVDTGTFR